MVRMDLPARMENRAGDRRGKVDAIEVYFRDALYSTLDHNLSVSSILRTRWVKNRTISRNPSARIAGKIRYFMPYETRGEELTFVDGMRSVVHIPGVQMTVPENMFRKIPIMLSVCKAC